MALAKNVAKIERIVRIALAVALIAFGASLAGLWRLAFVVAGAFFLITAFVGY